MNASGWLQFALIMLGIVAITKPLGIYLVQVLDPEHQGPTFLDRVLGPIERFIYRVIGVDPKKEQDWKQYAVSMILFTAVGTVFTYVLLRGRSSCRSTRRASMRCVPISPSIRRLASRRIPTGRAMAAKPP